MKSNQLQKLTTDTLKRELQPGEARVLHACREAVAAGRTAAMKMLIAGQMLLEHREEMMTCHSGKSLAWANKNKPESDQFGLWLESNGIASRTAYRWMDAAERIGRAQLGIAMSEDYRPVIEIEGAQSMSLSAALTLPEAELPPRALEFRQGLLDFMADKSLSEAVASVLDGESPAHRITRASGGKAHGGTRGEDRKAFEKFTEQKLKHLTTFFGAKLHVNQKSAILVEFNGALEKWPRWLVEGIADKCRTELKMTDEARKQRGSF